MELNGALLNISHYKVRIKCKVKQSREWSNALSNISAIEKGAVGSPSTKVANFTNVYILFLLISVYTKVYLSITFSLSTYLSIYLSINLSIYIYMIYVIFSWCKSICTPCQLNLRHYSVGLSFFCHSSMYVIFPFCNWPPPPQSVRPYSHPS